jgi:mannitol-1-/sugar-/sorbitol-6-/2-deoxyglucose-6-phosphatase
MVQASIFDMDGILIDSEPLWQEAEISVFSSIGVPMTQALQAETTGLRTDETVQYWRRRYPWSGPSDDEIGKQIDQTVLGLIKQRGQAKPGAYEVIALCERLGLPLAIASSSAMPIIQAVLTKLKLGDKFNVILSAESEPYGKPNPDVYIDTAQKLGVDTHECLVIEDSVNGVLSAKAATMYCIAVPAPELRHNKQYGIADAIVDSLLDITETMIRHLG